MDDLPDRRRPIRRTLGRSNDDTLMMAVSDMAAVVVLDGLDGAGATVYCNQTVIRSGVMGEVVGSRRGGELFI